MSLTIAANNRTAASSNWLQWLMAALVYLLLVGRGNYRQRLQGRRHVRRNAVFALQVALVHLSYNILDVIVIYGLPFLRVIPMRADEGLAALAGRRKLYVPLYIGLVFFLIPAVLIGVSQSMGR